MSRKTNASSRLGTLLRQAVANETNYEVRYELVVQAVLEARRWGLEAGFGLDLSGRPEFDGYRVVAYIELSTGKQIAWHLPEHGKDWDGHATPGKFVAVAEWNTLPYGS